MSNDYPIQQLIKNLRNTRLSACMQTSRTCALFCHVFTTLIFPATRAPAWDQMKPFSIGNDIMHLRRRHHYFGPSRAPVPLKRQRRHNCFDNHFFTPKLISLSPAQSIAKNDGDRSLSLSIPGAWRELWILHSSHLHQTCWLVKCKLSKRIL